MLTRLAPRGTHLAGLLLVAIPLVALAAPSDGATLPLAPEAVSGSCTYSPVHNTARIEATPVGTITGGRDINGTGGSIWFTQIFDYYPPLYVKRTRLVGPDGFESEPTNPVGTTAIFHRVPLCHTGTWRLVDHDTERTLSRFQTALDPTEPSPATVDLDEPVPTEAVESYKAGTFDDGYPDYEGDTTLTAPADHPQRVNVTADWTLDVDYTPAPSRVIASLYAEGQNRTGITTVELVDGQTGTVSVYPSWRAPSTPEVLMHSWRFNEDGRLTTHASNGRTLVITRERGPSP